MKKMQAYLDLAREYFKKPELHAILRKEPCGRAMRDSNLFASALMLSGCYQHIGNQSATTVAAYCNAGIPSSCIALQLTTR